jgi:hypothetical protein
MSDLVELLFRGTSRGFHERLAAQAFVRRHVQRSAWLRQHAPNDHPARIHWHDFELVSLRAFRLYQCTPASESPPGTRAPQTPPRPRELVAHFDTREEAEAARASKIDVFCSAHTPLPFDARAWRAAVRESVDVANLSDNELDKHTAQMTATHAARVARVRPYAEQSWLVEEAPPGAIMLREQDALDIPPGIIEGELLDDEPPGG